MSMKCGRHILIVDDCKPFRETVKACLIEDGYRVSVAADSRALREIMSRDPADLVIIDLKLSGEDGFSHIHFLREHHHCGVIMLAAQTDIMDRIISLEIGADDYVCVKDL